MTATAQKPEKMFTRQAEGVIQNQVRQGDVLLHPIDSIPEGAKPFDVQDRLVLAEGEVTGHAHAIYGAKPGEKQKFKAFMLEDKLYLDVLEPVEVVHEEHAAQVLQPGKYEAVRQVERWMDEVRRVAD